MKRVIKLAQTVLLCLIVSNVFSQKLNSIQGVSPQTANSSSALKAAASSEDLATGTAQNTLPVTSIGVDGVEIPISLNYASTGIRVGEYASWVGLGWNLSGPVSIIRNVRNAPDEGHTQYSEYDDQSFQYGGWYEDPHPQFTDTNGDDYTAVSYYSESDATEGSHDKRRLACRSMIDTESDAYTINLPGRAISFYFSSDTNADGTAKIKTIPANLPIKIEVDFNYYMFKKWIVTDENGIEYHFGRKTENVNGTAISTDYIDRVRSFGENMMDDFAATQIYPVTTAWHCFKIVTPNARKEITFDYKQQRYRNGDLGGETAWRKGQPQNVNALSNDCPKEPYDLETIQKLTISDINDYILNSITTDNKTIFFHTNTIRNDHGNGFGAWIDSHDLYGMEAPTPQIGGPYLLDEIEVQVNGACTENYELQYLEHTSNNKGWDDTNFESSDIILDKTHYFLDAFNKISCNASSTMSLNHSFEYYLDDYGYAGVKMPRRLSFAKDYSNLFNGQDYQRTLISSAFDNWGNKRCGVFADRTPSFPEMQYGILTKIILPTGGSTQYNYEPNEVAVETGIAVDDLIENVQLNETINESDPYNLERTFNGIGEFTTASAYDKCVLIVDLGKGCDCIPLEIEGGICVYDNEKLRINIQKLNASGQVIENVDAFTFEGRFTEHNETLSSLQPNTTYRASVNGCGFATVKILQKRSTDKIKYGGLRLKQKIIEDGDNLNDDLIYNYEYNFSSITDEQTGAFAGTTGKMAYNLYPNSIFASLIYSYGEGYLYAQRSSRFDPYNISQPVLYEYVKVKQQGIDGFTLHQYNVPQSSFTNKYEFVNSHVVSERSSFARPHKDILENSSNYLKWGTPLETVVFDSNFQEVAKTEYDYQIIEDGANLVGNQWDLFYSKYSQTETDLRRNIVIPYTIKTGYPQLNSVTTTQDGISVEQKYTYHNTNPSLISKVENKTNGTTANSSQEEYLYPIDFQNSAELSANAQAAIDLMIARNIVTAKVESKKYDLDFGTTQVYEGNRTDFKIHTNTQGTQVLVPEIVKVYQRGNLNIKNRFANFNDDGVPLKTYTAKFGANDQHEVTNAAKYDQTPVEVTIDSNNFITHQTIGSRVTQFFDDDGDNLPDRTQDYNGIESTIEYDELGRVKAKTKNNGDIRIDFNVTLNVDAPGIGKTNLYTKITSFPNDNSIKNEHTRIFKDGLNRMIIEISDGYNVEQGNPNVAQKTISYDTAGRVNTETNALGVTSTYVYSNSPLSRVKEVVTPVGTSTTSIDVNTQALLLNNRTYQVKSLVKKTVVDVDGKETVTYQDHLNRQVKAVEFSDGSELITTYDFDQFGNLTECKPPMGDSYLYTYDAKGLLNSKTIPAQGTTLFRYDELGRQVAVTDAKGNNFVYVYDEFERRTKSGLYNGTLPTNTIYFGIGTNALQPTQVLQETVFDGVKDWVLEEKEFDQKTNQILSTTFLNDDLGRQKNITQPNHLNGTDVRTFTFNDAGQQLTQTHVHGNNSLLNNKLTNNWIYHYDENQRETGVSFNGQRLNELVYNKFDQLEKRKLHSNGDASYLQTIDYTYDNLGRLTHINDIEAQTEANSVSVKLCTETVSFVSYNNPHINKLTRFKDGLEIEMPLQNNSFGLSQTDIDAFIINFKNDLQNEGIIYDDVEIYTKTNSHDQSVLVTIAILQTNASFTKIETAGNGIDKPSINRFNKSNCCGTTESYDLFAERIEYDGNQMVFNEWQVAGGQFHSYNYRYDDLNRLRFANYAYRNSYADAPNGDGDFWPTSANPQTGRYSTQYQYDNIGNITALYRKGLLSSNTYGQIDALVYNYDVNNVYSGQLQSITEYGSTAKGFKNSSSNYIYDLNGNLFTDSGKGITANHNYLNLPETINKSANRYIQMHYTGTGALAQRQYIDNTTNTTINKDYIGEIEYFDGELMGINHEEGRIRLVEHNGQLKPVFEYSIRDYKGSSRVTFTDNNLNGTVFKEDMLQENHYYPYGMEMEGDFLGASTPEFPLQYGGMDLVRELELDVYFTKYRTLDPTIGRWWQADPKAEDFVNRTPYNSMNNNPVIFVDPDGDEPLLTIYLIYVGVRSAINAVKLFSDSNKSLGTQITLGILYVGINVAAAAVTSGAFEGISELGTWAQFGINVGVNLVQNLSNAALTNQAYFSKGGDNGEADCGYKCLKNKNYLSALGNTGISALLNLGGIGFKSAIKGINNRLVNNPNKHKFLQGVKKIFDSKAFKHYYKNENKRLYDAAFRELWSTRNVIGKFKNDGNKKWYGANENHSFSWFLWKRYISRAAIEGGSAKDNWWRKYSY